MNIIVKECKDDNNENNFTNDENQLIKVMSFNMKRNYFSFGFHSWKKRVKIIVDLLKQHQPDIIGTQELLEKNLKDLQQYLPEYSFVGEGRRGKNKGEYAAIFYRKDKFILKDQQTFWLSKTPNKPSRSWFALFPRICTTCTLALRDDPQQLIRVFNTHLDHLSWISRKNGLLLISNIMNEKNDLEPAKVLLMGDFNTTSTSKTLRRWNDELLLKNTIHLTNSYYKFSINKIGCSYHGFKGRIKGSPVDFIFVSHDLAIQKTELCRYKVNNRYPSDHYPVFVHLAFS